MLPLFAPFGHTVACTSAFDKARGERCRPRPFVPSHQCLFTTSHRFLSEGPSQFSENIISLNRIRPPPPSPIIPPFVQSHRCDQCDKKWANSSPPPLLGPDPFFNPPPIRQFPSESMVPPQCMFGPHDCDHIEGCKVLREGGFRSLSKNPLSSQHRRWGGSFVPPIQTDLKYKKKYIAHRGARSVPRMAVVTFASRVCATAAIATMKGYRPGDPPTQRGRGGSPAYHSLLLNLFLAICNFFCAEQGF